MLGNLAALLALIPAAVTTPAALVPTVAAPTDVTVVWTGPTSHEIAVTWAEAGDYSDRVLLVGAGADAGDDVIGTVAAGHPNRLVLDTGTVPGLYNSNLRIAVEAIDADDRPISDRGRSPIFDSDVPPAPVMVSDTPRADGTIEVVWRPGVFHDDNPGDPLDRPDDRGTTYIPVATDAHFDFLLPAGPPTQRISAVITTLRPDHTAGPVLDPPGRVGARTQNGWGPSDGELLYDATRLNVTIPHTATTGGKLTVTGKSVDSYDFCDVTDCRPAQRADPDRLLDLQARTGQPAAWHTVAATRTGRNGRFAFRVTSPGTRDYRVIAPLVAGNPHRAAQAYAETPATTTHSGEAGSSDGGGLPITGAPTALIAVAGGLLVALGAVLAALTRRRRRHPGTVA